MALLYGKLENELPLRITTVSKCIKIIYLTYFHIIKCTPLTSPQQ